MSVSAPFTVCGCDATNQFRKVWGHVWSKIDRKQAQIWTARLPSGTQKPACILRLFSRPHTRSPTARCTKCNVGRHTRHAARHYRHGYATGSASRASRTIDREEESGCQIWLDLAEERVQRRSVHQAPKMECSSCHIGVKPGTTMPRMSPAVTSRCPRAPIVARGNNPNTRVYAL